jgi:hypothetical protein
MLKETTNDLYLTKDNLETVKADLMETSIDLKETRQDLELTKNQLVDTNRTLETVKADLCVANTMLNENKDALVETSDQLDLIRDKLEYTQTKMFGVTDTLNNTKTLVDIHTKDMEGLTTTLTKTDTMVDQLMNSCQITFRHTQLKSQHMFNHLATCYGGCTDINTILRYYPMNITELEINLPWGQISGIDPGCKYVDWTKLIMFPQLKELIIDGHAFYAFYDEASSVSLEQLTITDSAANHHHGGSAQLFSDHKSFVWLRRFPNLRSLDIRKIHMHQTDLDILDFLPECPNLKCIDMHTASRALINYFKANRIDLHTVN